MPKVYNKRHNDVPKDAVYVGRPTKWGNQFKIGDPHPQSDTGKLVLDRDSAVDWYEYYIHHTPELQAEAKRELKGKDLVCWCAPKRCHADVLLEIANEDAPTFIRVDGVEVPRTATEIAGDWKLRGL